ncbi:MAG: 4-hydroxythreonine-4-phosphate dehydrogenase PdxA [Ignavibacteriae bacterium]|nr:4-hydroxythreonine-4-phosphate dehydrogenase PdxA [Ignavibacteriota bacterium]
MKTIITIGDCNGIGMEVLLKALLHIHTHSLLPNHTFTFCGNSRTIIEYAQKIGYEITKLKSSIVLNKTIEFPILEIAEYSPVNFGVITETAAQLAILSLETAILSTINGEYDAIVTMPISKIALSQVGWQFPGQTEMLAHYCNRANPMMILATDTIRVALTTIHIPIKDVSGAITQSGISERIHKINNSMKNDFAILSPRIAVLGLNPHAGENGHIGKEEQDNVNPAIMECFGWGIDVHGTFPADGFFAHGEYKKYDAILAMYHDQGLIPLKLLANGGGVNITAGLPIVRTSPDHGTAYSIAGKGIADEKSTVEAIMMAATIANNRKNN